MSARAEDDVRLRALMVRYQAGEMAAFDEIYARVTPPVRRFLASRVRDASRVDDLAQETFLQMHRARHTYDPADPLMPLAIAIARHVWLMRLRADSRRPLAVEPIEELPIGVRADAESYADREQVRDALLALPPARRRALLWHHHWGLSFREIAARMGIRETAAKLRSSRGVAQLRSLLGNDGPDVPPRRKTSDD